MAAPHLAGVESPHDLLGHNPARRRLLDRVADGLPSRWTESMAAVRAGERPPAGVAHRVAPARARAAVHPSTVLEQPRAVEALADHLEEATGPVAAWLAKLSLLRPGPFSYPVPPPPLLPAAAVALLFLHQGWIDALVAGATSLAIHATADVALVSAL